MTRNLSTFAWRAATSLVLLASAAIATTPATADTSYLRPNWFTTATDDLVTAQSSFTESFSNPAIGVKSEAWTVIDPDGATLARGVSAYSSEDAVRLIGRKSEEFEAILGYRGRPALIHVDDMVLVG